MLGTVFAELNAVSTLSNRAKDKGVHVCGM